MGGFIVQQRQADLFEVILALCAACRLARRLHRRQQQRDQDADDRNHHQEFHEGKTRGFGDLEIWRFGNVMLSAHNTSIRTHNLVGVNPQSPNLQISKSPNHLRFRQPRATSASTPITNSEQELGSGTDAMGIHRIINRIGNKCHALVARMAVIAEVRRVLVDAAQVHEHAVGRVLRADLLFDGVDGRIRSQDETRHENVRIAAVFQPADQRFEAALERRGVKGSHVHVLAKLQDNDVRLRIDLGLELGVAVGGISLLERCCRY